MPFFFQNNTLLDEVFRKGKKRNRNIRSLSFLSHQTDRSACRAPAKESE